MINLSLNKQKKGAKLVAEAIAGSPETLEDFEQGKEVVLLPLNTGNTYSEQFPLLKFSCPGRPSVLYRPAISLPRVQVIPFTLDLQEDVRDYMAIDRINPQPEAPWLNRVKGAIQFTDTVLEIDTDPETEDERLKQDTDSEDKDSYSRRPHSAVYASNWLD